jgi:hypothetical protein
MRIAKERVVDWLDWRIGVGPEFNFIPFSKVGAPILKALFVGLAVGIERQGSSQFHMK